MDRLVGVVVDVERLLVRWREANVGAYNELWVPDTERLVDTDDRRLDERLIESEEPPETARLVDGKAGLRNLPFEGPAPADRPA